MKGKVIRHTCDNRGCINIDHLIIGSYQDNTNDMLERGREARGFDLPHTVLSDEQRATIALRLAAGERNMDLASEYGVARSTISTIARRAREPRRNSIAGDEKS